MDKAKGFLAPYINKITKKKSSFLFFLSFKKNSIIIVKVTAGDGCYLNQSKQVTEFKYIMELIDAPRGPCSDESVGSIVTGFLSSQPSINDSNVEAILDSIVGGLVLPQPLDHKSIAHGFFAPFQDEIDKLHEEVRFCIWSMNIALSVYMQLLNFVDISVRMEISNLVSQRLSEWKGEINTTLSDRMNELIKSEFEKHSLTNIPDMEYLQRDKNSHILCSTVASYIKDIAIRLYASMRY